MSGPAYYNSIGISTWIPNRKEITTNKYNYLLDKMENIDIVKPRRMITKECDWFEPGTLEQSSEVCYDD